LLRLQQIQLFLDVGLHGVRAGGGVVAAERLALGADEEFLKVPRDVVLLDGGEVVALCITHDQLRACTRSLKEGVQELLLCSVTIGLSREWEIGYEIVSGADVSQSEGDLNVRSWFLEPELVGGDGQKLKVSVIDIGLDCIPLNILVGEPSVCC